MPRRSRRSQKKQPMLATESPSRDMCLELTPLLDSSTPKRAVDHQQIKLEHSPEHKISLWRQNSPHRSIMNIFDDPADFLMEIEESVADQEYTTALNRIGEQVHHIFEVLLMVENDMQNELSLP